MLFNFSPVKKTHQMIFLHFDILDLNLNFDSIVYRKNEDGKNETERKKQKSRSI